MSSFKKIKKTAIEKKEKKGDVGLSKGEQRVRELQSVKNMIDSLELSDEIDRSQAEMLKTSYHEAGKKAHKFEVEDVVKSAKMDLETNKSDVTAERGKVEDAFRKIGDMKGATDLARNEAGKVEGNLKSSAGEYKEMETVTENIEAEQEQLSQRIFDKIESLFG
jgi:hypothetical protein